MEGEVEGGRGKVKGKGTGGEGVEEGMRKGTGKARGLKAIESAM